MTATQTAVPRDGHRVRPDPDHGAPRRPGRPGTADRRPDLAAALRPLLIDVGIPLGTYYLLHDAFGAEPVARPWR